MNRPCSRLRLVVLTSVPLLMSCSEGTPLESAHVATTMYATSPTSLSVTAGDALTDLPTVIVADAKGHPVAGVPITFALSDFKGAISDARPITNAAGTARLGGWTVSTSIGMSTVTASSGVLAPVTFRVTTVAGTPLYLRKFLGDNQIATAGTTLVTPPAVLVTDKHGNPVSGVAVTFELAGPDGSLGGAATVTDASGVANVGRWTLGTALEQSVIARSGSMAAVRFVATAIESIGCDRSTALPFQSVMELELSAESCRDSTGRPFAVFSLNGPDASARTLSLTSNSFDTFLDLRDALGVPFASNDNLSATSTSSRINVLLPPGTFTLIATSRGAPTVGRFAISSGFSQEMPGCDPIIVGRGLTTMGFSTSICTTASRVRADRFRIRLSAGSTLLVRVEDYCYCDPQFEIADPAGVMIGAGEQSSSYVRQLSFSAPSAGYYVITVFSDDLGAKYELTLR